MPIAVALASNAVTRAGCGQANGRNAASEAGLPKPGARPGGGATAGAGPDRGFRQRFARETGLRTDFGSGGGQ